MADPATKSGSIYLITDCCMVANAEKISTGELPVSELGVSAQTIFNALEEFTTYSKLFTPALGAVVDLVFGD